MHWRLFRPINLAIIGIIQIIVQYNVMRIHMPASVVLFEHWQFAMIVIISICAGAAGYVVNDIYDVEIDAHNKPGKNVIAQISKRSGWMLYIGISIAGLILTVLLGNPYRIPGIGVFISATIMLWAYSAHFKRYPLIGNIIVSLFAALVVYVIWLGQSVNIPQGVQVTFPYHIVMMFTCFAFLLTLIREIVKDVEDLSGDSLYGARTLPAVVGINGSKYICIAISLLLACGIGYWLYKMSGGVLPIAQWYMGLAVILPVITITWFIAKAGSQSAWHFISQYLKVVMLAGILFLLLI